MTDLDRPYGGEHRTEARPPMPYFPAPSAAPAAQQAPGAPLAGASAAQHAAAQQAAAQQAVAQQAAAQQAAAQPLAAPQSAVSTGTILPPSPAPAEFAATGRRRVSDPFAGESYTQEPYTPQESYAQESYAQSSYAPEQVAADPFQPDLYKPEPAAAAPPSPAAPSLDEQVRGGVQGQIKIEDEVVEKIAALAALEVTGVAALGGQSRTSETMEAVRQRIGMSDRGEPRVRARISDNEISVDIALIVEYGSVVMEVAKVVKSNVARVVGVMLGMRVASVNVTVEDVRMPDDAPHQ